MPTAAVMWDVAALIAVMAVLLYFVLHGIARAIGRDGTDD